MVVSTKTCRLYLKWITEKLSNLYTYVRKIMILLICFQFKNLEKKNLKIKEKLKERMI